MTALGIWSLILISYQTFFWVTFAWLILSCKLTPDSDDLHEVTLMKLLYLYDPVACRRVYFYNVTTFDDHKAFTNVLWPLENDISAAFRTKVQLWLYMHLFWLFFATFNVVQEERSFSFYATTLPFTLTGLALLVLDVVHAAIFLNDAIYTKTESSIISYISDTGHVRVMKKYQGAKVKHSSDTSWISLLLAFVSVRGIVQWIFNYWLVKDNFYEGLKRYRFRRKLLESKLKL